MPTRWWTSPRAWAAALGLGLSSCSKTAHESAVVTVAAIESVPSQSATVATTIRLSSGLSLLVPLREVTVHAVTQGASAVPWIVASGWYCEDCDALEEIRLIRAARGPDTTASAPYAYPGEQLMGESDSVVFRSRLFVGACGMGAESQAVWLQEYEAETRGWTSEMLVVTLGTRATVRTLPRSPATDSLVLRAAARGSCQEVPGRRQAIF